MTDTNENNTPLIAYKGMDLRMRCRDFQYELGKTYTHEGEVVLCAAGGFHSCEYPLDTFSYYAPFESRYFLVEAAGKIARDDSDTKIASAQVTIKAELKVPELVQRAIEWITQRCKKDDSHHATGDQSASSATGDQSASSATGDRSASSATGYQSASSATGYQSASSATGDQSASSATGDQSASSATGDRSASSATGDQSASSATGDQSASSATGDQSASSATGDRSASSAEGVAAVAMNIGQFGKAKASEGGAIVLCYHNDDGTLRHIRAAKIGEHGIKPDTWYSLDADGKFVELPAPGDAT